MEKMGFCCQGLENPLLMEWEKAEKDSESEGGEEGISHRWVRVNGYKDNALCLWAWVHVRAKWAETNGAEPEGLRTKRHYKQLHKYYAFGVTSNAGRGALDTQAYKHLHLDTTVAHTFDLVHGFNFGHKLILLSLVYRDFYFANMFKRRVSTLQLRWSVFCISTHPSMAAVGGHNSIKCHTIQVRPNTEHKN